jgi:hypothetical protein
MKVFSVRTLIEIMTRKGIAVTLSLQERDKEALQQIALDLGITWGDKPNISKLIEAIARQELLVLPNNDWTDDRIAALDTARKILLDNGKDQASRIIAELLVSRSEIKIPLRSELESFLVQPKPTWRKIIDSRSPTAMPPIEPSPLPSATPPSNRSKNVNTCNVGAKKAPATKTYPPSTTTGH